MPLVVPPSPPPLYPKQRDAIYDPARISCVDASTKSGKTAGCIHWSYVSAVGQADRKGLWIEPTYTMAKDIGYARLKMMLTRVDHGKTVWDCSDSALEIRFANGSLIRFKGGDNPDGIYGEDYHFAVIDEASRCKEAAWHAVRSTLTATRGPVRIIGNVRGRKNWAWKLGQLAKSGTEGMAYHKLTAYDAVEGGVLDVQEIDDAKLVLPEAVFRELYLAEPTDDGANPFDVRAIARCVQPMGSGPAVAFGVDLAKSIDWTVVTGLDAKGQVCVFERWQSDWATTKRRIAHLIRGVPSLIDSTGVGDPIVEDLIQMGMRADGYQFTAASKQRLMVGLASAIQSQDVGVLDGVMRDELESFEFEYWSGGVRYSAPDGMHDDCVCSLALAVQSRASVAREDFFYFRAG